MLRNIITIILIIIVITVIKFFYQLLCVLNTGASEKPNACRLNTRGS